MQNLGYKDGENNKFRTRKRIWAEKTKAPHFFLTQLQSPLLEGRKHPFCL